MLRACLNVWPDAEITMEANPGTAEAGRFRDYAASGVTRFSLGIQSFDDAQLKKLGRIHDSAQARAAIEMAQRAAPRVNLDMMFALPGQTLAACVDDLRQAIGFGTEHLSLYHLTMEPNTVFAKFPPKTCRTTTPAPRCRTRSRPNLPRPAWRATRSRRTRGPARAAATT